MPIEKVIKKVTEEIQGHLDKHWGIGEGTVSDLTPHSPVWEKSVEEYKKKKIDGIAKKGRTRGNKR